MSTPNTTPNEQPDKNENARKQALMQLESVRAMVAALTVDYDRLGELRDKAKEGHWAAGWNLPGCLPDSEPARFEGWADARDYLADQMEQEAESLLDSLVGADLSDEAERDRARASELVEDAKALRSLTGEEDWGRTLGRFHWWVSKGAHLAAGDEAEELAELEEAAGDCENEDEARDRILEDALSVEVRSGWHSVGETLEPSEFSILLCTGGPAVRIRGELNQYKEPHQAWLEFQDWFTSWEELVAPGEGASEALLKYAQQFHFGE
jgi:hypothetical protein